MNLTAFDRPTDRPSVAAGAWDRNRRSEVTRGIDRLSVSCPVTYLGTIASGQPTTATSMFAFPDAPYSAGGETVTVPSVEGTNSVHFTASRGYSFHYDSGTGKVLAYTGAGTEVSGTNLFTALGSMSYEVRGHRPSTQRPVFVAKEDTDLLSVSIVSSGTTSRVASNYWSMRPIVHTTDGEQEKLLESAFRTDERILTEYLPDTIWESPTVAGHHLAPGDTVHLEIAETGLAAHIADLAVIVAVRRRVK